MGQHQQILILWQQGKSERKIAKTLSLSRTTVHNYLKNHKLRYTPAKGLLSPESISYIPSYNSSNRTRRRLSREMIAMIEECLSKNTVKLAQGLGKQRMRATDIHRHLHAAGHQISYSTVTDYIREHHHLQREAFIRQTVQPGSTVEFDWGEVQLRINGKVQKLYPRSPKYCTGR